MKAENYITSYCRINSNGTLLNGKAIYTASGDSDGPLYLKSIYKHFGINYPKFYKMDSLCKLAFLTSEILFRENEITSKYKSEDIALVISNSSSSLEVDTIYQESINDRQNYFPSPAVFVYTLPNILIGEIAIRNAIKGENTFFIFATFDVDFITKYTNSLLNKGKAECCVSGWVEFYDGKFDALLYTIEREPGKMNLLYTIENTNLIFKSN